MKKQFFACLFSVFMACLPCCFASADDNQVTTQTVTGQVVDKDDMTPLMYANVIAFKDEECKVFDKNGDYTKGVTTDEEGRFTLEQVQSNSCIQITYVGYAPQIIKIKDLQTLVYMTKSQGVLKTVNITTCKPDSKQLNCVVERDIKSIQETKVVGHGEKIYAHGYKFNQLSEELKNKLQNSVNEFKKKCDVDILSEPGVKEVNTSTDGDFWNTEMDVLDNNATLDDLSGYEIAQCIIQSCDEDYVLNDNVCTECTIENFFNGQTHIKQVGVQNNKCVIIDCEEFFGVSDNKCVQNDCTTDQLSDLQATSGIIENSTCVPTACEDDYVIKNKKCEKCDKNLLPNPERILSVKKENNVCVADKCIDGYDLINGYCVSDKDLKKKQKAYDDTKAQEQSWANRSLTTATVVATGIGAMELAQGLSEQRADKAAAADMAAYISTFRCDYGGGKSVKAGPDEIELPGGNNQTLMNYRAEYFALANDLKDRKTALNMKPGIESESILDKSQLGLYDDENTGITSGNEASLYRAQMLKSEEDQAKLDEASAASQKRVKAGAIALGSGVAGSALGNQIINGELGQKLKSAIKNNKVGYETQNLLKKEATALKKWQECLKKSGVQDIEGLKFENFFPSVLSLQAGDNPLPCNNKNNTLFNASVNPENVKATDLFVDVADAEQVYNNLKKYFTPYALRIMIGYYSLSSRSTDADFVKVLNASILSVQRNFKKAEEQDKNDAKSMGIDLENVARAVTGNGLKDVSSLFSGFAGEDSEFNLSSFLNK